MSGAMRWRWKIGVLRLTPKSQNFATRDLHPTFKEGDITQELRDLKK